MTIEHENLGTVNTNKVTLTNNGKSVIIVFSYETPVVIKGMGRQLVRQNDWSTTTGKLLNKFESDKKLRVDKQTFEDYMGFVMFDLINNK